MIVRGFFAGLLLSTPAAALELCHGADRAARKVTCLVDGDTGWEHGIKWRLIDIDTPEYAGQAECSQERDLAAAATYRMLELMRAGYSVQWLHELDRGKKRELVKIQLADGRDASEVLLSEGHATRWPHVPGVWCR